MGNEITREMYTGGPRAGAATKDAGGLQQQHEQQHEQQQANCAQREADVDAETRAPADRVNEALRRPNPKEDGSDKRQIPTPRRNNAAAVRGRQAAGEKIMSTKASGSQRTAIAAKGRKLFSDFHLAQAEYAQKWGQSRGEEGVAELFQTEAPRLHGLYEIVRAEAAGVTAVVFRARDIKTDKIVALKFVRIQVRGISDEARRKDCKEEARLQRLCAHENVVNLIDFEMGQKFAIFVLEYVNQTLLQNIVDRNENELYCERTAATYIRDIARALSKCHARGVVHMDVKLDNILCTETNVAKLCDFGVAEQMHHPHAPIRRHVAAPLFAPPEVYTLGFCDTAADMWSLGVVLYILLCGYPPFKETELKKRILSARYVFPERDWTQVSVMARDLVSRLLVLNVEQRFTADQVLAHPWIQALDTMPCHAENSAQAAPEARPAAAAADAGVPDAMPPPPDAWLMNPEAVRSAAASAPPGRADPSAVQITGALASVEGRTVPRQIMDELDTTNVPLPLRVTSFLRGMHHYRELEKRGFDSIPGGELYRNLLDGVDDIASGLARGYSSSSASPRSLLDESASDAVSSSWLSRRIDRTLFRESSDSSHSSEYAAASGSTAASANASETPPLGRRSSRRTRGRRARTDDDDNDDDDDDDAFSGAKGTAKPGAAGESGRGETQVIDDDVDDEEDDASLTEKDLYVQAKFKRRESIVSAAEGMSRPRRRSVGSSSTSVRRMVGNSGARPATQRSAASDNVAVPPRRHLVREKSFDVQPEEVMDWIDDSEAVSCRICDAEFTLFVRKHHCRNCSNLMCDSCSSHRRRLKILEIREPVRVCKLCAAHLP